MKDSNANIMTTQMKPAVKLESNLISLEVKNRMLWPLTKSSLTMLIATIIH